MATEDARYRQSSQFKLWSFSTALLGELRADTNKLARDGISDRLVATAAAQNGGSSSSTATATSTATSAAAAGAGTGTGSAVIAAPAGNGGSGANTPLPDGQVLPDFLTPAEEKQLVDYYTVELLRAGKFMQLDTEIQATAAIFFRRFYVTSSIMTYPPTEMLKTSLFFGAKAEGFYAGLDW